jgi:hypothetical protein
VAAGYGDIARWRPHPGPQGIQNESGRIIEDGITTNNETCSFFKIKIPSSQFVLPLSKKGEKN